ncbi:hypothetical protein ACIA8K_26175 [Catenuloplanes sp. NPDC051500]|uniref:hypothetical protein n=1 Tax=Catenuloplanes sp. NPDC051500 TaxID=3363959 RepID=UPI00378F3DD7
MNTKRLVRALVGTAIAVSVAALPATPALAVSKAPVAEAATRTAAKAPAQKPHPEFAGRQFKSSDNPAVYVIDPAGYRRHIPDPQTWRQLFRVQQAEVNDLIKLIPTGKPLESGSFLGKASGQDAIYLIGNGRKRWITSPAVMDKYRFDWNKVVTISKAALNAIPTGANWS